MPRKSSLIWVSSNAGEEANAGMSVVQEDGATLISAGILPIDSSNPPTKGLGCNTALRLDSWGWF
jgi:hypothetical protein